MAHSELIQGKWHSMTIAEQLGNVGWEYSRMSSNYNKNAARFNSARDRFLELLDLTISDPRWSTYRKKELLHLREIGDKDFSPDLQSYFDRFAALARK